MKKTVLILSALSMGIISHAQTKHHVISKKTTTKATNKINKDTVILNNEIDSISYVMGMSIAEFAKQNDLPGLNLSILSKAATNGKEGKTPLFNPYQAAQVMEKVREKKMEKMQAEAKAQAAPEKAKGIEFLAKNKLQDSVVALPDGLQYKILKQGTGALPTTTDNVKVNYVGSLLDGTEFDNSYKRGTPLDIDVNGVIKGWTEILQKMPVGSKYRVFIPSDLAYGDNGAGQMIKPGSTLIFDIELLDINKK